MIIEALLASAVASGTPAPTDDYWYANYPSRAGSEVTPNTAMQVTAVLACVRVLAETVAQLPLHLMATDGRMRRQAVDSGLYEVLHDQPNDWQTSFEFREMMQGHLTLRGNAYAQIKPGPRGAVDGLAPLHPDRMQVFRLDSGRIGYLYRDRQGVEYRLTQDEVFHLRAMSLNDCVGMSVIAASHNAIELAQNLDEHGIKFFRNAARPSGILRFPAEHAPLTEEQRVKLKASWRGAHTGADLFKTAILEGGVEWQQLGLSNEDSQWLESKRKSVTEIAMMFRVPPHMIGSAIEHGHTYANVEQSDLAFTKYTMLPWLRRWEQAIGRDLIAQPAGAAERLYAKFAVEGLLRADTATRANYYQTMLRNRVYTRNEVRALEDMNPVVGGDEFEAQSQPAVVPGGGGNGEAMAADLADLKVTLLEEGGMARDSLCVTRDDIVAAVTTAVKEDGESSRARIGLATQYLSEGQCRDTASLAATSEKHRDEVKQAVQDGNAATAQPATQGAPLVAWIADVAERIAAAEIELLEKRADKAAEDRERFDAWAKRHWGGKGGDYLSRAVVPILSACGMKKDAQAVATGICKATVTQLTTDDPVEVLRRWQGGSRAEEIVKHLTEVVNDG